MGRAHEKSSQSMLLFLMQKNQITCIKNEVMVILLIEKVIDNKMFPKSTAGLYISDSYQRNFISHRHRIFYGLLKAVPFSLIIPHQHKKVVPDYNTLSDGNITFFVRIWKHIAIKICICYNASRQKVIAFQYERRNESPNRSSVQSGDSSFLLYWQSTQ